MSTDKHYNEPGELIEPLEDDKPTDMPATRGMFLTILLVVAIGLLTLVVIDLVM